jgi:nucleoside-diphosphate-sugar epimerase
VASTRLVSVLVLGGTGWLSREVAAHAVARGHDVTCLARGQAGAPPTGASLVLGDRSRPDAYAGLPEGSWDLVVDVTSQPGYVRSAVRALSDNARHWVYVSSCSVYRDNSEPGADESAEILPGLAADEATLEQYGEGKVACEDALRAALSDRLLVARPGLICGYGDRSDRFGYWPWRFDRAKDATVLVPGPLDAPVQLVDVIDLAGWLVDAGLSGATGTVNAVGEQRRFGDVVTACRDATGHHGDVVVADPDWLTGQGVQPWMGPRSLPVWTPRDEYAGFLARSRAAAEALGLPDPSLDRLVQGALAWERALDPARTRRAGLTDDEQRELIAAL